MTRAGHAATAALTALIAVVSLAACGTSRSGAPDWRPKPQVRAEQAPNPQLPSPAPGQPGAPGTPGPTPSPGESGTPGPDPTVVAKNLSFPVGLTIMPDGSALVGERSTGRILRVQPEAGHDPVEVRRLDGLDASGDGGLLDLMLSPYYAQDGLILAYITTATDNRVVHFTRAGPVTPILTAIPKGATGNSGRLAADSAGHILIGTGDAGQPALAADPASLAGKVLRTDDLGAPAPGNPAPGSAVWTSGHHTVDGLCVEGSTGRTYATEAGPGEEINALVAGRSYGWPTPTARSTGPAATLAPDYSGAAGCAVGQGVLYLATTTSASLLSASINADGSVGAVGVILAGTYGRLRTVVLAPDGALWLTTTNKDGAGSPLPDDERVIRLLAPTDGGNPAV